jgi:predicted nucleic acid-binding protein
MIYADSSFLFSYYASDSLSSRADAWRQAHPLPLWFHALHRLELRNALELAVFQQRLTHHESVAVWQTIETDLRAGLLTSVLLPWADALRDAEALAAQHTAHAGTRSLDILHVAAARLLGAAELVTFDQRQIDLAVRVGLPAPSL